MGEGRHVRFTVRSGGARSQAVAFGNGGRLPVGEDVPADAVFSLEVNEFRGTVQPRLVLRHVQPCAPRPITVLGEAERLPRRGLARARGRRARGGPRAGHDRADGVRPARSRRGRHPDRARGERRAGARRVRGRRAPARRTCTSASAALPSATTGPSSTTPALADRFAHVALLDPPAWSHADAVARAGDPASHVHLCWGPSEVAFARGSLVRDYDLRPALADCYRALRAAGRCEGAQLAGALAGPSVGPGPPGETREDGPPPSAGDRPGVPHRPAALAGRVLRVLSELSLVEVDRRARGGVRHRRRAHRARSLADLPRRAAGARGGAGAPARRRDAAYRARPSIRAAAGGVSGGRRRPGSAAAGGGASRPTVRPGVEADVCSIFFHHERKKIEQTSRSRPAGRGRTDGHPRTPRPHDRGPTNVLFSSAGSCLTL